MTTHHRLKCLISGGRSFKLPTKHITVRSTMGIISTSDLTQATEEVRDLWQVRVGAQALILPRYNKQHKQNQVTLALLIRVVAKINVRIKQNPGYGMLKYSITSMGV